MFLLNGVKKYKPRTVVLNQGWFGPQGTFSHVGDILLVTGRKLEEGAAPGIQGREARAGPPCTVSSPSQNVNRVEKPRSRVM